MLEADIAIVGAGIAGASLAFQLQGPRQVVLLEREAQPGAHSTGRSAAMFMESYGAPMARALTRASRGFYEQPPPGFSSGPVLAPRGVVYVAWPGQAAELAALEAELRHTCPTLQRIGADEVLHRSPALRPECVLGGLWEPDATDIDVHALHGGYLAGFRRAGGVLRCGAELLQARPQNGGWELRFGQGEPLRARVLVNAAGAWADAVAVACGVAPLGLQPKRRAAFRFKAPEAVDVTHWPTTAAVDETFYFKPDAGQLLGSPANADPVHPHDVQPEELDIATGIHHIELRTTLQIRRPTATWAGLRTFAGDGELVIGLDASAPGFFWLGGQGGYGIQSAQGAALLAASLLLQQPLPEELRREGVRAEAMAPQRLR